MTRELLYEIRQKIRTGKGVGELAMTQALEEIETLFEGAKSHGNVDDFLSREASSVIDAIACERQALTAALLRWLPNDDLDELAKALCYSADVHYLQSKVAVDFELADSDVGRAEAVALRLVSNNATPAISIGWLLSLADKYGHSETTMALVKELMAYHVDELPVSSEQLLSNEKNPLVRSDVSRDALEYLRTFKEHLDGLPEVRELVMPVHMRLMQASIRRKRNRAINAGSEKRSFFAALFKAQHFKYSNRTAVEIHHGDRTDEQTLTMAQFSVSMELPISEMTDPIAAHFQRRGYWKRGKR